MLVNLAAYPILSPRGLCTLGIRKNIFVYQFNCTDEIRLPGNGTLPRSNVLDSDRVIIINHNNKVNYD